MIEWNEPAPNIYRCQVGEFALEVWQEPKPHSRWFVNWWLRAEGGFHKTLHGKHPMKATNPDWAQVEASQVFRDWFNTWSSEILNKLPKQASETPKLNYTSDDYFIDDEYN